MRISINGQGPTEPEVKLELRTSGGDVQLIDKGCESRGVILSIRNGGIYVASSYGGALPTVAQHRVRVHDG